MHASGIQHARHRRESRTCDGLDRRNDGDHGPRHVAENGRLRDPDDRSAHVSEEWSGNDCAHRLTDGWRHRRSNSRDDGSTDTVDRLVTVRRGMLLDRRGDVPDDRRYQRGHRGGDRALRPRPVGISFGRGSG